MEQVKEMPSSIFPGGDYERVEPAQVKIPSFGIVIFLVVVFILLKTFIYTPDEKRDGK